MEKRMTILSWEGIVAMVPGIRAGREGGFASRV